MTVSEPQHYSPSNVRVIMNWKLYEGERWLSRPIQYIRICLKELRNVVKITGKLVVSSKLESGTY